MFYSFVANTRRDFEDRYFLDALHYLEETEWVSNVGVCGFRAAPLALAQKNGLTIASNLVGVFVVVVAILLCYANRPLAARILLTKG